MELFSYWMKKLFIPNIPRPVLLLLDGHSSHYEPGTIRFAEEEGKIILRLPPHNTHVLHPLDLTFFDYLKYLVTKHATNICRINQDVLLQNINHPPLIAWYKAIKPETIVSGFRKAGICPFNAQASLSQKMYLYLQLLKKFLHL